MKNDKRQTSFVNIGLSSLMIVFLVLCLTTFAILSLSSAKSDYSFSEKLAGYRTAYYEASSQAESVNAQIDELMDTVWQDSPGDAYMPELLQALSDFRPEGTELTLNMDDDECTISYQVPVDDTKALYVTLQVMDPSAHDNYYEILSWQEKSTSEWNGNQTLELMPIN